MQTPRELVRYFRGFLTIPAAISLSGLVVAGIVFKTEQALVKWGWSASDWLSVSNRTASDVLSAISAASMSALVMVYSIVLLVYTLAAGSIGPRLLQRFGEDRVNQIAVGSLGATFLYSLMILWLVRDDTSVNLAVVVGIIYSIVSVLLLLLFVHTVSTRVTIDQEAARISEALDRQVSTAIENSADIPSSEAIPEEGDKRPVPASGTGYVNSINTEELVRAAKQAGAVVVFDVQPGDFMVPSDILANVHGDCDESLNGLVQAAAPLIPARDPNGDIRFSVHLLVEIALRALSPGVNDTFTAIVCIDRLSASLARAWSSKLCTGVYRDDDGAVRVVYPSITAESLFHDSMPALRRAARGNGLVTAALIRALVRIAEAAPEKEARAIVDELSAVRDETRESDMLERDIEKFCGQIETAMRRLS
ncbi:DUF2254 domain-containing protein [Ruegeria sp. HKCCD6228]|uniref:DUF2254 domain-containing protein n=1 Tax=Ruegeria sp. HKCCD6228 TaxID=2683001 RepID=UPI001491B309|nr:DUF2254 domain-containing protein [Ruegeria sp. HKCCD6228]NOD99615.1 DUF2254 domain-containing protein [Ruegeria sp. HKCCD6228]